MNEEERTKLQDILRKFEQSTIKGIMGQPQEVVYTEVWAERMIDELLAHHDQRLTEEIEGMKRDIDNEDYPKYCACDGECFGACRQSLDIGHNSALSAVQERLKNQPYKRG